MASEIRVNTINNSSGLGTITISDTGHVFSGITTIGSVTINGGTVTGTTGSFSGTVTANSFSGDGSSLTGIDATQIVTGNTSVQTVDTGSDGHVKINTEGSERFRVGSAGQLGIGGATYGTSGQVLTSQGSSSAPQWATPSPDATYGTYTAFNTGSGFLRVTGLNSNTKKTTILVVNWSPASSVNGFLNLGTSSGIEGTGYQGTGWYQNAAAKSYVNQSSYFVLPIGNSNHALNGRIIITEIDPTNYSYLAEAYLGDTNTGLMCGFSGTKQLSGKFERFDLGWLSGNIDGGAYTVVQEV